VEDEVLAAAADDRLSCVLKKSENTSNLQACLYKEQGLQQFNIIQFND
jgi:hypothetical protein